MLDAFRAEMFRLTRNRTTVFWSVLFAPLAALVIAIAIALFTKSQEAKLMAQAGLAHAPSGGPVELAPILTGGMGPALPAVFCFLLVGAASIYATDYRWETWRLVCARNSRLNLFGGKAIAVGALAAIAILVMLVSALVGQVFGAVLFGRPLGLTMGGEDVAASTLTLFVDWIRIVQFSALAALLAVLARSLVAALLVPLGVWVAQSIASVPLGMLGVAPESWTNLLIRPDDAHKALMTVIQGVDLPPSMEAADLVLRGGVSLGLWLVVPLAGALMLFQRQDIAKE